MHRQKYRRLILFPDFMNLFSANFGAIWSQRDVCASFVLKKMLFPLYGFPAVSLCTFPLTRGAGGPAQFFSVGMNIRRNARYRGFPPLNSNRTLNITFASDEILRLSKMKRWNLLPFSKMKRWKDEICYLSVRWKDEICYLSVRWEDEIYKERWNLWNVG